MSVFERIAEEKILAAIEAGEFSQLKGKGRPLNLEMDPSVDEDWELAYHILKNNHFTPEWIEMNREIERMIKEIRTRFYSIFIHCGTAVERSFESEHFVAEVKALNKKIFDYNLLVPVIQFQRRLLNVHVELESMFQILKTNSSID
jgi:DnaJ family protein C protein 28